MLPLKLLLTLLAAFTLGTLAPAPATAAKQTKPIARACAEGVPPGARCGTIEVPEDRSKPRRRRLHLAFTIVPGDAPAGAAPTFLLAGGPGQGAAEFVSNAVTELRAVDRHGDLVFIDQRGTGASNPLFCEAGFDLLGAGRSADVRACAASLSAKASLGRYGTPDAVLDLEAARAALGYDRINLFAVSYGTRVAWAYMRAYPGRVRAAYLRAAAGPSFNVIRDGLANAEAELMRVVAGCEADRDCASDYPRLRAQLAEVRGRLARAPERIDGLGAELAVTPELFEQTLYAAMLEPGARQQLPFMIGLISEVGFRPIGVIFREIRARLYGKLPIGTYLSVVCGEDAPAVEAREFEGAAGLAALGARLKAVCADWPVKPVDRAFFRPFSVDVPTLIVSGGLDPSTNAAAGEALYAMLPHSRHIIAPTAAHGPIVPNCVQWHAATLFKTGRVSPDEVDCSKPPLPPFQRRQAP